jgi:hypothetical protein
MNSVKIALDVDGVLADIILVWIKEYNRKHGKSMSKESIKNWDFWRELRVEKYEFYHQLSHCWSRWKEVPTMEESIAEAVDKLHSIGAVDIVTARDQESTKYVINWLEHNGIKYKEYVAVDDGRDKADLDYDIFIDDSPHNAVRMVKKGRNVLLYDQPWNKSIEDVKVIRIKKLAEAVDIISDLKVKFGDQYKMQNFLE